MSSGSRERYRQDIILSLAMPKDDILQFRYQEIWISPKALTKFDDKSLLNELALIVYIDQFSKEHNPEVIPCRFSRIVGYDKCGSTITISLKLKEFAFASDIHNFNAQVKGFSGDTVPVWNEHKKPKGYYCVWIDSSDLSTVNHSCELKVWESIVNQLSKRLDFSSEKVFYLVKSMNDAVTQKKIEPVNGLYGLKALHEYELKLYHYHPDEGKSHAYIKCETNSAYLTCLTNPKMLINSRYDLKTYRFLTCDTPTDMQTILSIYRGEGEAEIPQLDFDLRLKIKAKKMKKVMIGIVIGAVLAAPHISNVCSNNQYTDKVKYILGSIAVITSLIAGLLASFNIKKGI